MWDCAERKSTGPVRLKPADRPEQVGLPWLVYPVCRYLTYIEKKRFLTQHNIFLKTPQKLT